MKGKSPKRFLIQSKCSFAKFLYRHNYVDSHYLRFLRRKRAKDTMELATKLLSTVNSVTTDQSVTSRHHYPATSAGSKILLSRQRASTVRPKTSYFPGMEDDNPTHTSATMAGFSTTSTGDHVISSPQPLPPPQYTKGVKSVKEKKKVARSSTFKKKEKEEKEKEKEKEKMVVSPSVPAEESTLIPEQHYISCISSLKSSLEDMIVSSDN